MTFSNFKPLGSRFAEIDITTGMWWWKRTRTVIIAKAISFHSRAIGNIGLWYFNEVPNEWCPPEVRECEREYYRSNQLD